MRTIFPSENGNFQSHPKNSPNVSGCLRSENVQKVKFPKRLRLRGRGKVLATIYKRQDCYRLYWRARLDGKPTSRCKDFLTYTEAKTEGHKVVAGLVKGSQAAVLSPKQAGDALDALRKLQEYFEATGRRVSISDAAREFVDASKKANGIHLSEVVERFNATVVTVKRRDIALAVEDFITAEKSKTVPDKEGGRPEISPKHAYNRAIVLRRVAAAFPNTAVSDLAINHLDAFISRLTKIKSKSRNRRVASTAKSRNHHRPAGSFWTGLCARIT